MPKNIILDSLEKSFKSIFKNKRLFVFLLILQIIFFIIFSAINLIYQVRILEDAKAISEYINQQQLDDVSVASTILEQKSILGDDPLVISRHFNDIKKNFRFYLVYLFLLLTMFSSLFWSFTLKMIHKKKNKLFKNFSKMFVVLLFYLGLVFSFFFSLFNISLTELTSEGDLFSKYIFLLIVSVILLYFMFVSLSLINHTKLNNIVQRTLNIGIRKIHYVLPVYVINILLFAVSIILFFYFIDRNLFILLLSVLLMIFTFVFGRIFTVNVVEKLDGL